MSGWFLKRELGKEGKGLLETALSPLRSLCSNIHVVYMQIYTKHAVTQTPCSGLFAECIQNTPNFANLICFKFVAKNIWHFLKSWDGTSLTAAASPQINLANRRRSVQLFWHFFGANNFSIALCTINKEHAELTREGQICYRFIITGKISTETSIFNPK